MLLPTIPEPGTPFLNEDGTVNHIWYLFLYNLSLQTIGVQAASVGGGNVSPGQGQADANIIWSASQALI